MSDKLSCAHDTWVTPPSGGDHCASCFIGREDKVRVRRLEAELAAERAWRTRATVAATALLDALHYSFGTHDAERELRAVVVSPVLYPKELASPVSASTPISGRLRVVNIPNGFTINCACGKTKTWSEPQHIWLPEPAPHPIRLEIDGEWRVTLKYLRGGKVEMSTLHVSCAKTDPAPPLDMAGSE